jgi:hypothetical protein
MTMGAAREAWADANAKRHQAIRESEAASAVIHFLEAPERHESGSLIAAHVSALKYTSKQDASVYALRALINARPDLAEIALAAAEYAVRREAEKAGR